MILVNQGELEHRDEIGIDMTLVKHCLTQWHYGKNDIHDQVENLSMTVAWYLMAMNPLREDQIDTLDKSWLEGGRSSSSGEFRNSHLGDRGPDGRSLGSCRLGASPFSEGFGS